MNTSGDGEGKLIQSNRRAPRVEPASQVDCWSLKPYHPIEHNRENTGEDVLMTFHGRCSRLHDSASDFV